MRVKELLKRGCRASVRGLPPVPEPSTVDESYYGVEERLHSLEDIDRMVLLESGYSEDSPKYRKMLDDSVAQTEEKRIFTFDKTRSYEFEAAVDQILEDEVFDGYWHSLRDRLDPEADAALYEQWMPDGDDPSDVRDYRFMRDEVRKYLSKLKKVESFYYVEFFRQLLSKSENDDAVNLIDFDDPSFAKMPKVVRIY